MGQQPQAQARFVHQGLGAPQVLEALLVEPSSLLDQLEKSSTELNALVAMSFFKVRPCRSTRPLHSASETARVRETLV